MKISPLTVTLVIAMLVGCGSGERIPELVPVKGTITVDGEPGADLMVLFEPEGQKDVGASTAKTDVQGNYTLTYKGQRAGAPHGRYRVRIQHSDPAEVDDEALLPTRYNDSTELTVEVPSEKGYDFELRTGR